MFEYILLQPLQAAISQVHDMDDDALDELSLAREPRQRDSVSVKSEADLPTFQEWCEGTAPQLDTDSLQKHVKQMVDVSACSCYIMYSPTGNWDGDIGFKCPKGIY